ncbi:c-type cytochrome [Roseococcus suduntuyensis]|uniref:Mono/diheme cytochrome c family protein n=1 Tax=Roseococcus suduntuyensis TaxID=455361 RepID=A0A840A7C6_9PROT|nr:cytochrome c [Roseococcus suduntuyensis]MBB3897409.1 mono/diheme cytochrome c family protein [Roseococcus suduntuyensis]
MRRAFLICAITAMAMPALAQPTPLVEEGARLAQQWCANCHAIAPGQQPPMGDAAPTLPAVARRASDGSLRAFLQRPHANMPDHNLTRAELDAVVAYILSLRP